MAAQALVAINADFHGALIPHTPRWECLAFLGKPRVRVSLLLLRPGPVPIFLPGFRASARRGRTSFRPVFPWPRPPLGSPRWLPRLASAILRGRIHHRNGSHPGRSLWTTHFVASSSSSPPAMPNASTKHCTPSSSMAAAKRMPPSASTSVSTPSASRWASSGPPARPDSHPPFQRTPARAPPGRPAIADTARLPCRRRLPHP